MVIGAHTYCNSTLLLFFRCKLTFEFENYLHTMVNIKLRQSLTAFQSVSHRLETEIGRHKNIPRGQGPFRAIICSNQNKNITFLWCAQNVLGLKYFSKSFISWSNLQKFERLMKTKTSYISNDVSRFIVATNRVRSVIASSCVVLKGFG